MRQWSHMLQDTKHHHCDTTIIAVCTSIHVAHPCMNFGSLVKMLRTLLCYVLCYIHQVTKQLLVAFLCLGQARQAAALFWDHQEVHWSLR